MWQKVMRDPGESINLNVWTTDVKSLNFVSFHLNSCCNLFHYSKFAITWHVCTVLDPLARTHSRHIYHLGSDFQRDCRVNYIVLSRFSILVVYITNLQQLTSNLIGFISQSQPCSFVSIPTNVFPYGPKCIINFLVKPPISILFLANWIHSS
jgi:hypothetical protein